MVENKMPYEPQDDFSLLRSHSGRLITAAAFVNKQFLGTPYGCTSIPERLLNQRFLLELTLNGHKIYTNGPFFTDELGNELTNSGQDSKYGQGNLIYKISVRQPSDPLLYSITYEEADFAIFHPLSVPSTYKNKEKEWPKKREAFLKACNQGKVKVEPNVEALEKQGLIVNHVIHRPNHGLHHSLRVAASVPTILGFLGENQTASQIEKLQLMMLFSVVGREDETGFRETGEWGIGKETYQRFRTTSGLAYLDYCQAKEGIYTSDEKAHYLDYRNALTVELMGFAKINHALSAGKVSSITNKDRLKDRILKDTKRLVEMGTLTPEEADQINKAPNKDKAVEDLINKIMDPRQERYILGDAIPGVLVGFIEENYKKLAIPKDMFKAIEQAPNKTKVIKTLIPKILSEEDKCKQIFPFLFPNDATQAINYELEIMNWAHGLDLSRCYPLEAKYAVKVIPMPPGIKPGSLNWESTLSAELNKKHQNLLKDMDKNEGLVIIKSASDLFYIRHLDSRGEIRFSEINKNKNPSLIDLLNQTTAPKTLQMSQLLLAIADKAGQLPHKSQYFGNVQSMVGLIFSRSGGNWDNFKNEMDKLYDFFNSIQEMHIRTGERINFKLYPKEDFLKNFVNLPETEKLLSEYQKNPQLFVEKFTAHMLSKLYDGTNKQNYNNQAFRIFAETPEGIRQRDYLAEATNCARLIDSVPKPKEALKTSDLPEIKSLSYDSKEKKMLLVFATEEEAIKFQDLYKEVNKKSSDFQSDGLNVVIPLERYKYLRDNRYLKFQLETIPEKHSEEENLIDPNTGEYSALQLISKQSAVVRLHNTILDNEGKRAYDSELTAMNNPGTSRYVAATRTHFATLTEKEQYEERKNIRVPLTGIHQVRKEYLEASPPDPRYQQPALIELDHPDLAANAVYFKQGGAKNTRFLGKTAYTLLNPEGKTELFLGARNKRHLYFPIGILSDVNYMHKGGEKFIWKENATSWEKRWLGADKHPLFKEGISLEELKKQQKNGDAFEKQNELLLRGTKEAIRALVAPKNTLFDRLNLATQALQIKENYNITVPLIILDPKDPSCPKIYTEKMIRDDLQEVIQKVRKHQLPYDDSFVTIKKEKNGPEISVQKDKELQNELIKQLLEKCGFVVSLSTNTNLPIKDRLTIDSTHLISDDSIKIDKFLENLSVPGGVYAEMEQISDPEQFDNLPIEQKDNFFIKQVALGNLEVIENLLIKCNYFPSPVLFEKANEIASNRLENTQFDKIMEKIVLIGLQKTTINFREACKNITPEQLGTDMFSHFLLEKTKDALKRYIPGREEIIDEFYLKIPSQHKLLQAFEDLNQVISLANLIKQTEDLKQPLTRAIRYADTFKNTIKEQANELTVEDKFQIRKEIQNKINEIIPDKNFFKENVANIVSGIKCQDLSEKDQINLYLYNWQYKNGQSPIRRPSPNNLQQIESIIPLNKSELILKAIWENKFTTLSRLDPVIAIRVAIEKYLLIHATTEKKLTIEQIEKLISVADSAKKNLADNSKDNSKITLVNNLIEALEHNDEKLISKLISTSIVSNFKDFKEKFETSKSKQNSNSTNFSLT